MTLLKKYILALMSFLLIAGCSPKGPKKIKIGFSMDSLKEERWKKDLETFKKEVEAQGGEVLVQVANGDDQLQNEQAENLLTMGVDVLVIIPHNSMTPAVVVESAHKSGVKVIGYDRIILDCDLDLYISFDNVKVGELQAQYLVNKVPKGNYIIIGGAPTDFNAKLFSEGQMNILRPLIEKGDINLVLNQAAKDWQPIEGLKHTENGLTKAANNVQAVLASNDGLAGGAIQALTEQKLAGKVFVSGQDAELAACQRIIAGTQSMTVYKPLQNLALAAAKAAMSLARKEKVQTDKVVNNNKLNVPSILLAPISVDKENIEAIIVKEGFFKKEDLGL